MNAAGLNVFPEAGVVVSVPFFLFFSHKGIVSDRWHGGKPMVISNSARSGGVREESWDIFSGGQPVTVVGYPGDLPNHEVVHRARLRIGTQYRLFDWNCEHYVTQVHGLRPQSLQVAVTVALAALGIGMVAFTKR